MQNGARAGPAPTQTAAAIKDLARLRLRATTHALALGYSVTPAIQERVFGIDSPVMDAVKLLHRSGTNVGGHGTVSADVKVAQKALVELIKAIVADPAFIGSICIDDASFKHGSACAIVLLSRFFADGPVVLQVLQWEERKSAEGMADRIRETLAKYGLALEKIGCLVGDNVTFNAKVARILGLPLGKCLAHALNLVVKAAVEHFEELTPAVITLGGTIDRGGSMRRRNELKAVGLDAGKMKPYTNRLVSMVGPIKYILAHYATIRPFVMTELAAAGDGESSSDDGVDDIDDVDGSAAVGGRRSANSRVVAAYKDPTLPAVLFLANRLVGNFVEFVASASANHTDDAAVFVAKLNDWRNDLESYISGTDADDVRRSIFCFITPFNPFHQVVDRCIISLRQNGMDTAAAAATADRRRLIGMFKAAATAAVKPFDKHVTPQLAMLSRADLFDVTRVPAALPVKDRPLFFGLTPEECGCLLFLLLLSLFIIIVVFNLLLFIDIGLLKGMTPRWAQTTATTGPSGPTLPSGITTATATRFGERTASGFLCWRCLPSRRSSFRCRPSRQSGHSPWRARLTSRAARHSRGGRSYARYTFAPTSP